MDRAVIAALQCTMLGGLLLLGQNLEMGVAYYTSLVIAVLLGLRQQYLIHDRDREHCVDAFLNNAWLGGAVFAGIALDYIFRAMPADAL
jgi:4-hydroxybenzoate polyprenyltransferase